MPGNKILVKVGQKSTLHLREAKLYRAITVQELSNLSALHSDANIIIVERVYESEYKEMCDFLKGYLGSSENHVYFYSPENDDNTTGVADELSLDIYLSSSDLYHAIQVNCGINLDPDITKPHIDQSFLGDGDPFESDPFQDMIDVASTKIEIDMPAELPTIVSKDQLNESEFTDDELGIVEDEADKVEAEQEKQVEPVSETVEEIPQVGDTTSDVVQADPEIVAELRSQLDEAKSKIVGLTAELKAASDKNEGFTKQIDDLKSGHYADVKKIDELSSANKALKAERDTIRDEFGKIESAPVIEDPDMISDYEALKVKAAELESKLSDSSALSQEEVDKLQEMVNSLNSELDALKAERDSFEDKNAQLEISVAELTQKLEVATNDSSKDDRIAELTGQIGELSTEIEGLSAEVTDKENKLAEKISEISKLEESLAAEKSSKTLIYSFLHEAKQRLLEAESIRDQVAFLTKSKESLETTVAQLSAELNDARATANTLRSEGNTRVELAKKFVQAELDNAKTENIRLVSQVDILKNRLAAREAQYDQLVRATGVDENGASTLLETNRALESMNSELRRRLGETQTLCETNIREASEARQAAKSLQEQRDKLMIQIRTMSTGISGGMTSGVIPRINFSGRGSIICVAGSGSYGITTTAFSLAKRLYANSRVLFIDFDMLSAKADSWFKMNPVINGLPGTTDGSDKNTALGLLLDRGAPFLIQYAGTLFRRYETSKNGFLDYASGLYNKPDVVKFISADLSAFTNFCCNTYDYVIIDFGRIGATDVNNQVLNVYSAIAAKTVIVTSTDRIEIRNTRAEIQRIGINIKNVAWLVNLASSSKLDEKSKMRISPASVMVMPFLDDFYGQKKDFSSTRLSRDKLNVFLEQSILKK